MKIFFINDNQNDVDHAKSFFKNKKSDHVIYFNDPFIALDQMKSQMPDVIILEFKVKELTAEEFMTIYSERLLFAPRTIILYSDHTLDEFQSLHHQTLGIDLIVSKGANFDMLYNLITDTQKTA